MVDRWTMSRQSPDSGLAVKRPFLTVYDYGQGGVWRVLLAESADEVASKYPELKVLTKPPTWMTAELLHDIEADSTRDIDDQDDPFLASLRNHRA